MCTVYQGGCAHEASRSTSCHRVLGFLVHFAHARDASDLSCEVELLAVAAPPVQVAIDVPRAAKACRVGMLLGTNL